MTTLQFAKALAVIESCTTPGHIECANNWLSNINAPASLVSALQWRRVEIAASAAMNVADKIAEAEERLQEAQYCLAQAAKAKSVISIRVWTDAVRKSMKEVAYWNQYFETSEI